MRFLPIGLDVRGRPCLVVGAGEVGARKIRTLLRAGAAVLVVSPQAGEEVVRLCDSGRITWRRERYKADHLDGVVLAVAATDDRVANTLLVEEARARGVPVCDASSSERTQVIFGAIHEEDGLIVAVFSDGADPARSRQTRDRIAAMLDQSEEPKEPC
jgi:uroporphyrin-III C-methyltransferase/precorrin-2 dehydrogenase/sirohydrochlorin ferrochelatase